MIPTIQTALTMTSREIAAITEKEHTNVKRDIAAMILQLNNPHLMLKDCPDFHPSDLNGHGITLTTFDHCGNLYDEFILNQEYCLLLVSGYSVTLRQKIIKRWQELESKPQEPAHIIPKTYAEALMLAANQAAQLEQQAPMVEVYKLLADRKGDVSTTIIAKELGTTAIKLNKFLRDKGIKWLNADLPKAGYEKYFNVVADVKNGHEFTQCLVTPDGQIAIAKLWGEK